MPEQEIFTQVIQFGALGVLAFYIWIVNRNKKNNPNNETNHKLDKIIEILSWMKGRMESQ